MNFNAKTYYEGKYKETQFEADFSRKDRLRFCFEKGMKGKRIISLGSGPGVDIEFLATTNEVHAIDISEEALDIAGSKGMCTHILDLNNIEQLPFEDQSVHVVIATDILEHLFDPSKVLIEVHRVLKDEGFAILSVPNHFFWKMRIRILLGKDIILPFHKKAKQWDYFHIRFFTSKGFEELLFNSGFQISEKYYDQFIIVPRGLPQKLDRKLARRFPDLFSMHFIVKVVKK
ncbi:MAG: class I SAM-dependent methyltransferase [Thermoanaerobacteraceae bacterium]|nr:class I SAM-dependent methyltransferase [Thermoanaerobacteraceae bacterium]